MWGVCQTRTHDRLPAAPTTCPYCGTTLMEDDKKDHRIADATPITSERRCFIVTLCPRPAPPWRGAE
jgi:hypothetical protein